MSDLPPGYFTARELAVLLRRSRKTVLNLASKHQWRRARVGRTVGYNWLDVSRCLTNPKGNGNYRH